MIISAEKVAKGILHTTDSRLKRKEHLTPEWAQARYESRKTLGIHDYAFFYRSDVIDFAETHNLTLKEMSLLALIHDRSPRPDDASELEKTQEQIADIKTKLESAQAEYDAEFDRCKRQNLKTPLESKFNIPHLRHRLNDYQEKEESIADRITTGCWYETSRTRRRFCSTVGIQSRQYYKIRKKLLDLGAIILFDDKNLSERIEYTTAYRSTLERKEEKGVFYRIHADFRIFGYFDPAEFDVDCTLLDKAFLSICYQWLLPIKKQAKVTDARSIDAPYDAKGGGHYGHHRSCVEYDLLHGENRFSNAFDEQHSIMQMHTKTFCRLLRCSAKTVTRLRKKWSFLIKQHRIYGHSSTYHFVFDKEVLKNSYVEDETLLDPFFDAWKSPADELNNRVNLLLNAGNKEIQQEQDNVIAPALVEEYATLNLENAVAQFPEFSPKAQRFSELGLAIHLAQRKLGRPLNFAKPVDVYAGYLKRHPERDPVFIRQEQERIQLAQERERYWHEMCTPKITASIF